MKAQARKILALIMAMVMCLSLAAPAFAAEEAEAPEAEASVALEVQNATPTNVVAITLANADTANEGFKVDLNEGTDPTYKWSDTSYGDFVEVTTADYGSKRVGDYKQTKYTVTAKAAYVAAGEKAPVLERVVDDKSVQYSLEDSNIAWAPLTDTQNTLDSEPGKQVKGSLYQEEQADGTWIAFFKLTPVTGSPAAFDTSSTAKPLYFKYQKADKTKVASDLQIRKALKELTSANNVDKYGKAPSSLKGVPVVDNSAYSADWKYTYSIISADGAAVTGGENSFVVSSFTGTATTATIKTRVTYDANQFKRKTTPGLATDTTLETDADSVKNDLTKKQTNWTITSVTKNGDFMDVVIAKGNTMGGEKDDAFVSATNNVKQYTVGAVNEHGRNTTVQKVGLIDLNADGTYKANATDEKDTPINAGTKLYGAVAVKKSDMPEEVTGGTLTGDWYYFDSESVMKNTLRNSNCGKTQTIKYTKLIVNEKNGDKTNGGNAGVVPNAWATNTDVFTEEATPWVMPASSRHSYYVTEEITPATCKKAGTKVTKTVCAICGAVKGTPTTENLPIDQSSVKVYSTQDHKYNFYKQDGTTLVDPASAPTGHFIKTEKITTTLKTKETKGSIKHEYLCNYGEVHDEYTWTEETDKEAFEYSGRWDSASWGTQNTAAVKNPAALYGYTAFVYDTDFEVATLPINGANDKWFKFKSAEPQNDGTYLSGVQTQTVNVVSKGVDGNKKTTNTTYKAIAIVKDIKKGDKDCVDGSATIEINVYEIASTFTTDTDLYPAKVADTVKDKKAKLVKSHTQNVVVPAEKTHVDANNDGKCDNCEAEINQTTPVNENTVDISKATVTFKAMTYTGKAAQPSVTVTLDGVKLAKGVDYEVEELQDVDAGTYPLVVKGKGDFTGRVVGNVTIKQASSSMKIKSQPKTLTSKKKKAVTGQVKMTYTNSKLNKFAVATKVTGVSIDKKTGKITVKKNIKKKGTFKFKVTGKAKNANYTAPKAVTGKVVIKIGKK